MIERRRRFCGRDFLLDMLMCDSPLIILLIKKDQTVEGNGDGNRPRAFQLNGSIRYMGQLMLTAIIAIPLKSLS
jgi:hypothetical protein